MVAHRPLASARRQAVTLATQIGSEIERSRASLAMTIEQAARRAVLAPSTVVRVTNGDPGVHLDTLCAVASAVGLRISVKAFPASQPSLRDSGQLRIAEYLIAQAHDSLRPALELPVGDPYGRAADLVFFGPDEIVHKEIERRLLDFQDRYRAAGVKRAALQEQHARPVRLVLVIVDTRRNRELVAPHQALIRTALPAGSAAVLHSLRTGSALGRDGLLWVRPWRPHRGD